MAVGSKGMYILLPLIDVTCVLRKRWQRLLIGVGPDGFIVFTGMTNALESRFAVLMSSYAGGQSSTIVESIPPQYIYSWNAHNGQSVTVLISGSAHVRSSGVIMLWCYIMFTSAASLQCVLYG